MDLWGFKKWRRQLGYTQAVAGEKLGLSRGAVQYWESEHRPVPRAVELACQELLRLSKQQPDFGPVTLLYSDAPIGHDGSVVLQSERHLNNESALRSAAELKKTKILLTVLILEEDGNTVWSGPELLRQLDAGKSAAGADEKAPAGKTPSSQ
jgi:DNA-binding XRE family transcriptional regulator